MLFRGIKQIREEWLMIIDPKTAISGGLIDLALAISEKAGPHRKPTEGF